MFKPRKFVIGDIHAHYDEMKELFKCVDFQFDQDILISLGDLVDRGPNPIEVIEKLMQVKHFIHILGNHDDWCYRYLKYNKMPEEWKIQGGINTIAAYRDKPGVIEKHCKFFENAKLFFIDDNSRLFVHGGYNPRIPFYQQTEDKEVLIWDRSLILTAIEYEQENQTFTEFSEIFIGHTPTQYLGYSAPKRFSNLWMLDTGVFQSGKLTIMDIETKRYWQTGQNNI